MVATTSHDRSGQLPGAGIAPQPRRRKATDAWLRRHAELRRERRARGDQDFPASHSIGQDGKNSVCYGEYNSDGGWKPVVVRPTDVNLIDGKWHHIAAVSGKAGMKLYLNGILVGTCDYTGSFADIYSSDDQTRSLGYFGRAHWPQNEDFTGQLDEIRVWKVARTEEQIQTFPRENFSSTKTSNYNFQSKKSRSF